MSKVILSDDLIVALGRLLGEDYNRRGEAFQNDTQGLFVEAFMQVAKSEFFNDEADLLVAEEEDVIRFFESVAEGNKHAEQQNVKNG